MYTNPVKLPEQYYPCLDILKEEKISYSSSVTFNYKTLEEIQFYTREFTTIKDYKLCTVDLNIPMTGKDTGGRTRLLLYLDDEMIFDASSYDPTECCFKPLIISAKKINLLAGFHRLKLMGCVDSGNFNIPHFNIGTIEETINPRISGRLCIIGQN